MGLAIPWPDLPKPPSPEYPLNRINRSALDSVVVALSSSFGSFEDSSAAILAVMVFVSFIGEVAVTAPVEEEEEADDDDDDDDALTKPPDSLTFCFFKGRELELELESPFEDSLKPKP